MDEQSIANYMHCASRTHRTQSTLFVRVLLSSAKIVQSNSARNCRGWNYGVIHSNIPHIKSKWIWIENWFTNHTRIYIYIHTTLQDVRREEEKTRQVEFVKTINEIIYKELLLKSHFRFSSTHTHTYNIPRPTRKDAAHGVSVCVCHSWKFTFQSIGFSTHTYLSVHFAAMSIWNHCCTGSAGYVCRPLWPCPMIPLPAPVSRDNSPNILAHIHIIIIARHLYSHDSASPNDLAVY